MQFIKRTLIVFVILIIILFSFQKYLYNTFITYDSIGVRPNYIIKEKKLINYIDIQNENMNLKSVNEVITAGLYITTETLNFSTDKNDTDPNKLITSRNVHCVGYTSFFSATCNSLLKKSNLNETWEAKPHIGKLYLFGTNIHNFFDSSFFKDHDFVIIKNKISEKEIAIDPSLYEYLFISEVTLKK
ncbi:MAG: hypothetical protein COB15_06975 [Flavobacteriales bacterium]|nr:MAG: hypothetical protein COB15_06975 [Flavobacteriales bacterium]